MRLIYVLLLASIFLFVSTSSAIIFTEDDSFLLSNVTYRFFHNITFDFVSTDNKTITFNDVTFDINCSFPINITIDRILSPDNFNFTVSSNQNGTIHFIVAGSKFQVEYVNKTLIIEKGSVPLIVWANHTADVNTSGYIVYVNVSGSPLNETVNQTIIDFNANYTSPNFMANQNKGILESFTDTISTFVLANPIMFLLLFFIVPLVFIVVSGLFRRVPL